MKLLFFRGRPFLIQLKIELNKLTFIFFCYAYFLMVPWQSYETSSSHKSLRRDLMLGECCEEKNETKTNFMQINFKRMPRIILS